MTEEERGKDVEGGRGLMNSSVTLIRLERAGDGLWCLFALRSGEHAAMAAPVKLLHLRDHGHSTPFTVFYTSFMFLLPCPGKPLTFTFRESLSWVGPVLLIIASLLSSS